MPDSLVRSCFFSPPHRLVAAAFFVLLGLFELSLLIWNRSNTNVPFIFFCFNSQGTSRNDVTARA